MFYTKKDTQIGFTLLETLVGIGILIVAIVAPMVIYSRVIPDADLAKDRVTAAYLAQEGIEYVRYKIYVNNMNATVWNMGIACPTNTPCMIDANDESLILPQCSGGHNACIPVYFDPVNHTYTLVSSGNEQTKFTRSVSFTDISTADKEEAVLTSTVTWNHRNDPQSVTLKTNVINWAEGI